MERNNDYSNKAIDWLGDKGGGGEKGRKVIWPKDRLEIIFGQSRREIRDWTNLILDQKMVQVSRLIYVRCHEPPTLSDSRRLTGHRMNPYRGTVSLSFRKWKDGLLFDGINCFCYTQHTVRFLATRLIHMTCGSYPSLFGYKIVEIKLRTCRN